MEVILDKSQRTDKYSSATFLYNSGILTKIDTQHAIAHNKVMVIDGESVITAAKDEGSNLYPLLFKAVVKKAGGKLSQE